MIQVVNLLHALWAQGSLKEKVKKERKNNIKKSPHMWIWTEAEKQAQVVSTPAPQHNASLLYVSRQRNFEEDCDKKKVKNDLLKKYW